jgi:hypothetical protein
MVFVPVWQRACGNQPVVIYGRIIDPAGQSVPDAQVEYRILYSNFPVLPFMYGRTENTATLSVRTDKQGSYVLSGLYGYDVALTNVSYQGRNLESATGIPSTKQTAWSLDNIQDRAELPNDESRRIDYIFKEKSSRR